MVNNMTVLNLIVVKRVISAYVVVALGTLAALAVLSMTAPRLATSEAWSHAVIVAVFAILLVVRARAASKGSATALRAVTIIAGVLAAANIVEAALPGVFPSWMRVEMLAIAAMTLTLFVLARRARRAR